MNIEAKIVLTNKAIADRVSLTFTNYNPDINSLSGKRKQQKLQ